MLITFIDGLFSTLSWFHSHIHVTACPADGSFNCRFFSQGLEPFWIGNIFYILFVWNKPNYCFIGRLQWPRGLRHEMSSLAPTLGSWVRILLEAWMLVCVYSMFVFCVSSGLATGRESYQLCIWVRLRNLIRGGLGPIWAVSNIGWMDCFNRLIIVTYSGILFH
jgi:hypothetical protein